MLLVSQGETWIPVRSPLRFLDFFGSAVGVWAAGSCVLLSSFPSAANTIVNAMLFYCLDL